MNKPLDFYTLDRNTDRLLVKELERFFDRCNCTPTNDFYDLPYNKDKLRPLEWDLFDPVYARATASYDAAFAQNADTIFSVIHMLLMAHWVYVDFYDPTKNVRLSFDTLLHGSFFIRGYELLQTHKDRNDYLRALLADDVFTINDPVDQTVAYLYLRSLLIMHQRYWGVLLKPNHDAFSDYQWTFEIFAQRFVDYIPTPLRQAFYTNWMTYIHSRFTSYFYAYHRPTDSSEYYPLEQIIKTLAQKGCALAKADLAELDYEYACYIHPCRSHALSDMMDEYGEASSSYAEDMEEAYRYYKKAADAGHEKAKEALKTYF